MWKNQQALIAPVATQNTHIYYACNNVCPSVCELSEKTLIFAHARNPQQW